MIGGFQPLAFQPCYQQVNSTGAGRPRRTRYIVRVNGQEFSASTPEGAREIIRQAQALAKRAAELAAKREAVTIQKVRDLPRQAPKIVGPPELRKEIRAANRQIRETYQQTAIDYELIMLFKESQRIEDETLTILLM
jgi:hypothetical protein